MGKRAVLELNRAFLALKSSGVCMDWECHAIIKLQGKTGQNELKMKIF